MPIWEVAPVTEQAHLTLTGWQVMLLPNGDRHLVGYAVQNREGRASSAIATIDLVTLRAVTRSGRVYELKGRPGAGLDAEYTWRRWADINGAANWTDLSAEVWKTHQDASAGTDTEP